MEGTYIWGKSIYIWEKLSLDWDWVYKGETVYMGREYLRMRRVSVYKEGYLYTGRVFIRGRISIYGQGVYIC